MPVDDARLVEVAGRHFDIQIVADGDADEILTHFAGDVREHRAVIGNLTRNIVPDSTCLTKPVNSMGSS
jgi:hypothetical protein